MTVIVIERQILGNLLLVGGRRLHNMHAGFDCGTLLYAEPNGCKCNEDEHHHQYVSKGQMLRTKFHLLYGF